MKDLFRGKLVRLTAEDPKTMAESFSRWNRNSEYYRLLDNDPVVLWSQKKLQDWEEKALDEDREDGAFFAIRTLVDDHLIGFTGLFAQAQNHGDTLVGIGIGEPEYWGKGYGTDAMRLILQYAFTELNLYRVTLLVFGYNTRAIRSYEKCGFKMEGARRQAMMREGRRWDIIFMGILRSEWEQLADQAGVQR